MIRTFILLLMPIACLCQNSEADIYKKDARTKVQKEDGNNFYAAATVSETDVLKLLELLGGNVFKFPLKEFTKQYKMDIRLDEYQNGKKIKSESIFPFNDNKYYHFPKTKSGEEKRFYDYIDELTFFTSDPRNDSIASLKVETYGGGLTTTLKKRKEKPFQQYHWRSYSKTSWVLNKEVPLLVFASSWYDKDIDAYRFCGVSDLSKDAKATEELLKQSPHYFMISYIMSDNQSKKSL